MVSGSPTAKMEGEIRMIISTRETRNMKGRSCGNMGPSKYAFSKTRTRICGVGAIWGSEKGARVKNADAQPGKFSNELLLKD